MQQCPISDQVKGAMRRIPTGSLPPINRSVGFETLERCARRQPSNKSPGKDGHPREFCKHGPMELLELYYNAINAYLRGEPPSVGEHEWAGAIAGYIPKKLSALLMSDFRPIGCICTKHSLLLSIVDQRLNPRTEDQRLNPRTEGVREPAQIQVFCTGSSTT
jgi:hypothetical protein